MDKQYKLMELRRKDLNDDPITQFQLWYKEATEADFPFPNSFILSTSDNEGNISSRVLLLKGVDDKGFTFYTNENSRKGLDLSVNPKSSICFWWDRLERQVRICGDVTEIGDKEADKYFESRPRESKIGAWASNQSEIIENRLVLENSYKDYELKYREKPIPRPIFWKGYKLSPRSIEFWQGRDSRLHDRFLYTKQDSNWKIERLAP